MKKEEVWSVVFNGLGGLHIYRFLSSKFDETGCHICDKCLKGLNDPYVTEGTQVSR